MKSTSLYPVPDRSALPGGARIRDLEGWVDSEPARESRSEPGTYQPVAWKDSASG